VTAPTAREVTAALAREGFPACGRTSDGFWVQAVGEDTVVVAFRHAPGNRSCEDGDPDAVRMLGIYAGTLGEAGWTVIRSRTPGVPVLAVTAGPGRPAAAGTSRELAASPA
jgi:hypothetical protein